MPGHPLCRRSHPSGKRARPAASLDPDAKALAIHEATEAKLALDEAIVPSEPRLFSDDATVERLTSLLAEQGGRMAVLSPEGEIFSIAAGRYSGALNFAVLKKGHAGEEMRIDRMGRAERIEAATVTLGICTQPSVLAELGDTPAFRGEGLLGRILFAVPESLLGHRKPNPDPMPAHQEATYQTTLKALVLSLARLTEPTTLTFTDQAATAVTAMLADVEPRLAPSAGDLAHMTDWGGKLVGATVRIAGLLHLAKHLRDGWNQPIDADTFADARDIADYFTSHAKAAYDAIGADPATADARAILDWTRNTSAARLAARDAQPPLRARFKKVTDLDPALRVLESHGWIRRLPPPPRTGRGRPAAPLYEVHPAALETSR
ncbi:hypothetical protein GCM10029978_012470 [Actinoallomurus acanthiterrae]